MLRVSSGEHPDGGKVVASITREDKPQEIRKQTKEQRFYPLVELTLPRIREFVGEPEALFWSFVFPVLLAIALGIAFRNTGPERLRIAVASEASGGNGAGASAIADA